MSSGPDSILAPTPALSSAPPPAGTRAAIFGVAGRSLNAEERAFFAEARPFGFILFARNIETPAQTAAVVAEMRSAVGWDAPVLIDQEGGRVARLAPPHWRAWAPVGAWCDRADADPDWEHRLHVALEARGRWIAAELRVLGIDVNCAPLLDVRAPDGHDVIGARALGRAPGPIPARARALMTGQSAGGVASVIKHLPGHGRARVDSHVALPRVETDRAALSAVDFAPFKPVVDAPYGMTAHVVYETIDAEHPATLSPRIVDEVIRGEIGYDGALMTDDLSMGALSGSMRMRADASLAAGCDLLLHCNGDMAEMRTVAEAAPALAGRSAERATAALAARAARDPVDPAALRAALAPFEDIPVAGAPVDPTYGGTAHPAGA